MSKSSLVVMSLLAVALVGCDSRIDVVNQQMFKIRDQAPLPIEPAPVFTAVPSFTYSAMQLRNPFLPRSLAEELRVMAGKRVYPNLNRALEPLESYALETLMMKGSLRSGQGQIIALIQTPDGQIDRVQKGSYMGMNRGRVDSITPTQIHLTETVPDGRDGYIERPRTLVLLGASS